jgi:hypothetical protein
MAGALSAGTYDYPELDSDTADDAGAPVRGGPLAQVAANPEAEMYQSLAGQGSVSDQLSPLQRAQDAANKVKQQRIQDAIASLQAAQQGQTTNLPLLAAAGAMLAPPGGAGNFGTSLGRAFQAAAPALQQQRQQQQATQQQIANLGITSADVDTAAANQAMQDFYKRVQMAQTAASGATTAQNQATTAAETARHNAALERNAAATAGATAGYYKYLETPDEDEPDRYTPVLDPSTKKPLIDEQSGLGLYQPWAGNKSLGPPVPYDPATDTTQKNPADVQRVNWLMQNGLAPDTQTAWAMAHQGINDAATRARLVQAQMKIISSNNPKLTSDQLKSQAQTDVDSFFPRTGATGATAPAPKTEAPAAPSSGFNLLSPSTWGGHSSAASAPASTDDPITRARAAIAAGAPAAAVRKRLVDNGIDPSGL